MNALLAQFIPEARDLLEQAGVGMLALEQDATSKTVINDVFRAVHTLKGSSGLFDVGPLTRLVHAAEDLLDDVRNGGLSLTSDIVDRLLDSLDLAGCWIDALEAREELPGDAEIAMAELVASLRQSASRHEPVHSGLYQETSTRAPAPSGPPPWLAAFPEPDRRAALEKASSPYLLAWSFTPEENCFFRGDDPVAMLRHSPGLLAFDLKLTGTAPPLASFDPLNCMLRFEVISDISRDELTEHMRYVAEAVSISEITISDLGLTGPLARDAAASGDDVASDAGAPGETGPASNFDAGVYAYKIAQEQIRVLETPADPAIVAGRLEAAATVLKNLGKAAGIGNFEEAASTALSYFRDHRDKQLLLSLVERFNPDRAGGPGVVTDSRPAAQLVPAAAIPAPPERVASPAADGKAPPRVLRVDQAKIDEIMNLVAELIVAKNGLSYLATRADDVYGSRAMAREIKDQFAVIDRITQGLQVGVMSVRMMPVSQVFQRFPRLVRDIARKLDKMIDLVIEGEETEADKNVLESLADPLIHMVRNSLDHGIETPAERRAAGKPETGILKITARQENDFVVIEVSDDGRGIDPARVKAKALQLALITAEKAATMNDTEAANLVFAAGFSTKEQVSDLSGRGVGMDVVRSAVLKAGGDVALRSVLGSGTSVIVRLPLTMAVTRIVTIECRNQMFGIPMELVAETVRIRRDQIHKIKDMETFVLRETIIPVLRLAKSLLLPEVAGEPERTEEAVMIVRIGGERVGVIVDGFRERLEVIVKPLEGILDGMTQFSGTALLGDGRVLLILDLQEII